MDSRNQFPIVEKRCGDVCLADSATTHTILRDRKFFLNIRLREGKVNTISGPVDLIEGSGRAIILLASGTKLCIENALYSARSSRNLLSFKDIRRNGYHIETLDENNVEYICITKNISGKKYILEKLPALSSGLYYTIINAMESHVVMNQKFNNPNMFMLWHNRLGHPGATMIRRIIDNSNGHKLKNQKILLTDEISCTACSQGKLVIRPSLSKISLESPSFLQRIQGDICGPIHPHSGPFRYFMVLIDASARWSHVCLLSTRNIAFAKMLAQIIRLRAQFPDYPIKTIRLDNAGEFTSNAFKDYCTSLGIDVEHPVPHVHTQNGLAESLIKRIQVIARTLLLQTQLPVSTWGHAILHAAALLRFRPTAYHQYSPMQLVLGHQPDISHLRIFGCAVHVPISPPQRTKMGPQRRLGIYVGFDSPYIIRYLEPLTGDLFTARFADCHFDETTFPPLGEKKEPPEVRHELSWKVPTMTHLDPRTSQCENEVRKIIHLQQIANQLPDAFTDASKVTKSHIPAANTPARVIVPVEQSSVRAANESSIARQKRGRPLGSKDTIPRKRKMSDPDHIEYNARAMNMPISSESPVPEELIVSEKISTPIEAQKFTNEEKSTNYANTSEIWDRKEITIDNVFSYTVATEITNNFEPQTVDECRQRHDWPQWKEAIQAELTSLAKREVFGPVVQTPQDVKPVGYKWVFVRKRNERNEIIRYKARLVAQGFSQRPGIDYEDTYSPVMDTITFRFLISLAVSERLDMRLMDVVTSYLYGSLDTDIFMKIPEGLKMPEAYKSKDRKLCSIKLQRSLYGLKQSGRMWYNRLSEYLMKE